MSENAVSVPTIRRIPLYLTVLKRMAEQGREYVSSVALADEIMLNPSVVKKDLSFVIAKEGKPKLGYRVTDVISDIENFLGYNKSRQAVLIGAGKLGQALLGYSGFRDYGLDIVAAFDSDDRVIGKEVNGVPIVSSGKIATLVKKLDIKIAILTIPKEQAQAVADVVVNAGIRAIWNFTPTRLNLPASVAVRTENMAASLAVLSNQLDEILKAEEKKNG